jgi:hypothetical protein
MSNFPTTIKTLDNGLTIETRKYSTHWAMRVLNGSRVVATHSGINSNQSYKRKLIQRYESYRIAKVS